VTRVLLRVQWSITLLGACLWGAAADAQAGRGGGRPLPDNPAEAIQTLHGFTVELVLRSDPQKHGSWISLNKDDKGRLLIGGQRGQSLTRLTLENGKVAKEEVLRLPVSEVMGLLSVGDSLYVDAAAQLPGDAAPPAGARGGRGGGSAFALYRLHDPKGDGSFSSIERLHVWPSGSGEHGAHAILLDPDKKHLVIVVGNAVGKDAEAEPLSPMRHFADDRAISRREGGFMAGEKPPGGTIFRVDLDGRNVERFAAGQRNTYDIAINADDEILGFDSDMEWDWGLPWYRPTRVFHAISGGDFGYRGGSGKLPTYYEDTLPPVVNIGLGSPTGVVFGYGAKFPAKYQKALYIMDWSYGRLIAVHLRPNGSSYEATWENFVAPKSLHSTGQKVPLNLTDMVIGDDGTLYFTCGGRNTQGYLMRVTYSGSEPTAPADAHDQQGAEARALRHQLESYHGKANPAAVAAAWPHLGSDDRFIRFAARLAIEAQPIAEWKDKALAEKGNPQSAIEALLALARVGGKECAGDVYRALMRLPMGEMNEDLQSQKLRTLEVGISRNGKPEADLAKAVIADLDAFFPSYTPELNYDLAQVLLALDAPGAVGRAMKLVELARTQEEQIGYLLLLRQVREGWTPELRKAYFAWFNVDHADTPHPEFLLRWFDEAGRRYSNGNEYNLYLTNIRNDALAVLTDAEKADAELSAVINAYKPFNRGGRGGFGAQAPGGRGARGNAAPGGPTPGAQAQPPRQFVKAWKMDDLLASLNEVGNARNFARARAAYDAAQCSACHNMAGITSTGGVGPDLTAIASRFKRRDMLESILEPSKVVSEQFANTIVRLKNNDAVEGHILEETDDNLVVQINPLKPEKVTLKKADVVSRAASPLSPMPTSLVDNLSKEEILDLIAFLEAGGNADHPDFKRN
jgi:putative heme-binding domain-containing protein